MYIRRCLIPSNLLPPPISSAFRSQPSPLNTLNLRITPHIMAATSIIFVSLLAVALTSPVAVPDPNPQFSLPAPPLPSTFPFEGGAPPLPVLQAPTPALPSPPFQGSDIKPKKIGYFWTGAGDNQHAGKTFTRPSSCPAANKFHSSLDFLATYSLDDVRNRDFLASGALSDLAHLGYVWPIYLAYRCPYKWKQSTSFGAFDRWKDTCGRRLAFASENTGM